LIGRLTPEVALGRLGEAAGAEFISLFRHGSLEVEIYRPVGIDRQHPHTRDEVYVVISGSGFFQCGPDRRLFQASEVLFVPAGVDHRFEEFSEDFATWVFFYGPEGGEARAGVKS
jgi:mannose-6-phosphate isomerase-like protein (cupin superfamily)